MNDMAKVSLRVLTMLGMRLPSFTPLRKMVLSIYATVRLILTDCSNRGYRVLNTKGVEIYG